MPSDTPRSGDPPPLHPLKILSVRSVGPRTYFEGNLQILVVKTRLKSPGQGPTAPEGVKTLERGEQKKMSKPPRQNNPSDLRRTLEASGGLRELTPKISALGAHEGPLHVDHRLRVPDLGLRRPSKRERAERNLPLGSTSSRVSCPGLPFLARPTLRPRALKKGGSVLGLVSGPGQHTSFSVGSLSGPPGGPCFFFLR